FTTEAITKVGEAPADLRQTIVIVAEWKYRVTVGLGDGVAVTTARQDAVSICDQDFLVRVAVVSFEPREQRWAEVEVDERVIDDVWRVALGVDALIPIVKRRRTRLRIDFTGPWVLAWWLIKMAVDY